MLVVFSEFCMFLVFFRVLCVPCVSEFCVFLLVSDFSVFAVFEEFVVSAVFPVFLVF